MRSPCRDAHARAVAGMVPEGHANLGGQEARLAGACASPLASASLVPVAWPLRGCTQAGRNSRLSAFAPVPCRASGKPIAGNGSAAVAVQRVQAPAGLSGVRLSFACALCLPLPGAGCPARPAGLPSAVSHAKGRGSTPPFFGLAGGRFWSGVIPHWLRADTAKDRRPLRNGGRSCQMLSCEMLRRCRRR